MSKKKEAAPKTQKVIRKPVVSLNKSFKRLVALTGIYQGAERAYQLKLMLTKATEDAKMATEFFKEKKE